MIVIHDIGLNAHKSANSSLHSRQESRTQFRRMVKKLPMPKIPIPMSGTSQNTLWFAVQPYKRSPTGTKIAVIINNGILISYSLAERYNSACCRRQRAAFPESQRHHCAVFEFHTYGRVYETQATESGWMPVRGVWSSAVITPTIHT